MPRKKTPVASSTDFARSSKPPTLADVAARANVTAPTVAKVLSGKCGTTRVSDGTKERIQKIALEMGYRKHLGAAQLSTGRTDSIGVVLSRFSSPFYGALMKHLLFHLHRAGLNMVPLLHNSDVDPNQVSMDAWLHRRVDGIILLEDEYKKDYTSGNGRNLPIVERRFASGLEENSIPHVSVNYSIAFRKLIRHWIQAGRKCVGLLVQHANQGSLNRNNAKVKLYLSELENHNLQIDDNQQAIVSGQTRSEVMQSTFQKTLSLLHRNPALDALIIDSGELALPAYQAIHEAGRTIGQDLAVACWTETVDLPYLYPSLTSMDEPVHEVAEQLVNLLLTRLSLEENPPSIEVPTFLTERSSIG